jgi:integrase
MDEGKMLVKFTDKWVRSARPRNGEDRTDFWDTSKNGSGLGLRVSSSGSKIWVVMYRRAADGKKRRHRIGRYPALGLAEARKEASSIRARVDREEDPAGQRQQVRQEIRFRELAEEYLSKHAKAHRRTWAEDERRLNRNILPGIGEQRAKLISPADLLSIHDELTEAGSPVEANRNLELVRRIYSWGIGKRRVEVNPATRLQLNPEKSRDRILSHSEIKAFWNGLDKLAINDSTRRVLRMALLTGQRAGEVAGATVAELDLDHGLWTIPGSRTKNGITHAVPLSPAAQELFREALASAIDGKLFPSIKPKKSIDRRSISRAVARNLDQLGVAEFTPHDLRRTVASAMAALGIDRVVVGKVLNHATVDRDSITGSVYDRHGYEREKRNALNRWASKLEAIVQNHGV